MTTISYWLSLVFIAVMWIAAFFMGAVNAARADMLHEKLLEMPLAELTMIMVNV